MLCHDVEGKLSRSNLPTISASRTSSLGIPLLHGPRGRSTIDLIFTTQRLAEGHVRCAIHNMTHGSDHEAIETSFTISMPPAENEPRRFFKVANWERIRTTVARHLADRGVKGKEGLDAHLGRLMNAAAAAINKHVPFARPSPYARPWWTPKLIHPRKLHTQARKNLRRHIQVARSYPTRLQRPHAIYLELLKWAREMETTFYKNIGLEKKRHWNKFLDET